MALNVDVILASLSDSKTWNADFQICAILSCLAKRLDRASPNRCDDSRHLPS